MITPEILEKIYLNGKEINIRSESLSSIGITKVFVCEVELKKIYLSIYKQKNISNLPYILLINKKLKKIIIFIIF